MRQKLIELKGERQAHYFFLKILFIYFRERGREGKEEDRSCTPRTGDLAHNPGMCPDWELNRRPLGLKPELNPLSYTSRGDTPLTVEDISTLISTPDKENSSKVINAGRTEPDHEPTGSNQYLQNHLPDNSRVHIIFTHPWNIHQDNYSPGP